MIFAISSNTQAPGLDSGEAQSDGLAQCGGINVWDPVLVTDTTIGEVEPLARHITVGIWGVIGGEPRQIGDSMSLMPQ